MAEMANLDINQLIAQLSETSDPVMYQYFKNLKKKILIINVDISADGLEYIIMPLLEWDNDGTGEEITIYLQTNGGDVLTGLAICDVIGQLKTKTKLICLSYAYSMGSLILLSGNNNPNVTRYCYPFSTSLIHGGSNFINGSSSQIKDYFNFNTKYEKKIKEFILTHSKIAEKEYKKMETHEWYMDSDDMLKYGLVDEIIGNEIIEEKDEQTKIKLVK